MMSPLSKVVKHYPLISFFLLTIALSWWPLIVYAFNPSFFSVSAPLLALGPSLAAIIVTALSSGKVGLKALLSRMVRWRVGLKWYIAALGFPVAVWIVALSLNVLLFGASPSTEEQFGSWYLVFPLFAFSLLSPLSGALGEELGLRGFALPRVQGRVSALWAALIIGVIHVGWHLPVVISGNISAPLPWASILIGATIVYTWLFNNTRGSVLMTMMLHASENTTDPFIGTLFTGADFARMPWLVAVVYCVAGMVLVVVYGPKHLSRKNPKQEEPSEISAKPSVYGARPKAEPQTQ